MEIQEQQQGAVTVLKPRGALCATDADQFKQRVQGLLDRTFGRFVIDASEVPFLDSRGVEVLKETTDELSKSGRVLRLCAANETVREVLELTALSQFFEHYQDVNSAVRSFL